MLIVYVNNTSIRQYHMILFVVNSNVFLINDKVYGSINWPVNTIERPDKPGPSRRHCGRDVDRSIEHLTKFNTVINVVAC